MQSELASVWISANAGSGKTRALVDRVGRLLLLGVAAERICCITYTKAAASEMRERILAFLRHLMLKDETDCRQKITQLLKRPATDADIVRARGLFIAMLDSPFGGVQLTTIHGFCQQLLKKFPVEAGLSPLFSILDDAERAQLQRRARNRFFDLQSAHPATDALMLLADRSSEFRIHALLDAIDQQAYAWNEVFRHASPEHVTASIYEQLGVAAEMTSEDLRRSFCQMLLSAADIKHLRAALPQFLSHKNKGEQKLGNLLSRWLDNSESIDAQLTMLDALLECFVTQKYTPRAFSKNAPLPELLSRLREQCVAHKLQAASLMCAEESAALVHIAFTYRALMQQLKFEAQKLDYDDLIQRATELLAGPMIGWVMRKLDHRIDHLLVDEAQDTSPDQWRIVRALVEELMANSDGISAGEVPRTLLVVGDEKQSIFSFQGAAPGHFRSEANYFMNSLSESNAPLQFQTLQTSYRSANAVLRLVDAVVALPNVAPALGSAAAPHLLHRIGAAGCVRLYPLVIGQQMPAIEPFTIPTLYQESHSAFAQLANQIAAQIAGWLADGRLLISENRAMQPGDILILLHRRHPMAQALIRALEKHRVPVSGLDRLTLSKHLAVRDLLALMAWCMHPADDLSLAQVLRSPLVGMSDEGLRGIACQRLGNLWQALQMADQVTSEWLSTMLALRETAPYDFLTQLLEVGGARRRFAERFGEEVHEILDELKSQAANLPAGSIPSIACFYDWMAHSGRSIKREQVSGSNKVQIMTVHGAKGLEAPVVIMPDTMNVPNTTKEQMFFSNGQQAHPLPLIALSDEAAFAQSFVAAKEAKKSALAAEYQRLLYVALTRARDELHIYGAVAREAKTSEHNEESTSTVTSWYNTVTAAFRTLPEVQESADGVLEYRDSAESGKVNNLPQTRVVTVVPSWLQHPPSKERSPTVRALSASRMGEDISLQRGHKQSSRAYGIVVHRVLQWLRAKCDTTDLRSLISLAAPDWDANAQQKAFEEINQVFTEHAWIWHAPSHAELSIGGTIAINGHAQMFVGQIDRVVETGDGYAIIDYKTGAQATPILESYILQLKIYHALLKQVYPARTIRCALLWTSTSTLQWVDNEVQQAQWPAASVQELMDEP